MKTTLFATAFAVVAFASAPALAASGYVGASVSAIEVDSTFGDVNGESYGLTAAVFAPINETLSVQADVAFSDSDDVEPTIRGAAHLVADLGAGRRLGGFVAAADVANDAIYGFGVEGQLAASEQVTLAAALGYAKIDDADLDLVSVGAEGRFFVTENFRLGASLGYLDVQDVDLSVWSGGLDAEYQFTGAPVSVFGGWNRADADELDFTIDTFSIGVRYNFGGLTLKGRDRDGASMPGLNAVTGIASLL